MKKLLLFSAVYIANFNLFSQGNNCSSAINISLSTSSSTCLNNQVSQSNSAIWYKFTAIRSVTNFIVNYNSTQTAPISGAHVYTGQCNSLIELGATVDQYTDSLKIFLNTLSAGQTYYIKLDKSGTGVSSFTICSSPAEQLPYQITGNDIRFDGKIGVGKNPTVPLDVLGNANISGSLTSGATTVSSLSSGNISSSGNLNVAGTTTLTGAVTTGALTSGATNVSSLTSSGNLTVNGTTNLAAMNATSASISNLGGASGLVKTNATGALSALPFGTSTQYLSGNGSWINFPAIPAQLWSATGSSIYYNGNIGVNNPSPAYALDVTGQIRATSLPKGILYADATGVINTLPSGLSSQVLLGNGTWGNLPTAPSDLWTQSGSDIFYNAGNVGIKTTPTAAYALDVNGSVRISNTLYVGQGIVIAPANSLPPPSYPTAAISIQASELQTRVINADTIRMDSLSRFVGQANFTNELNVRGDAVFGSPVNLRSALTVGGNATFSGTVDAGQGLLFSGTPVLSFSPPVIASGVGGAPNASSSPSGQLRLLSNTSVSGTLNVSSLAGGTGLSEVYVDANGNLQKQIGGGGQQLSCATNSFNWNIGGNNIANFIGFANPPAIGTCDNNDFILKAYDKRYIWLKTDGKVGIGINNSTPIAQLDVIAPTGQDALRIGNSASNFMTIDHNGNVGIGTPSPLGVLSVISASSSPLLFLANSTYQGLFVVAPNGSTQILDGNPADPNPLLVITHSNGSTLQILANGSGDISSSASFSPHFGTGALDNFSIYQGTPGSGILHFNMVGGTGSSYFRTTDNNANGTAFMVVNDPGTGNNQVFKVNNDGNVTSAALAGGTSGSYRSLYVDYTGKIIPSSSSVSSSSGSAWVLGGNSPTANASLGTSDGSDLPFISGTGGEKMRITAAGNVIVNGGGGSANTSVVMGRADYGGNFGADLGYGTSYIGLNAIRDATAGTWTTNSDLSHNGGSVIFGSVHGDISFSPLPSTTNYNVPAQYSDAQIKANRTMRIVWNTNINKGQVFIGSKIPTLAPYKNALLTVSGVVAAQEIYVVDVTYGGWADYVFKKDYKLTPLPEVEKYINETGHLNNVPSSQEIKEKGQNLGKLQVTQMEKIEELTLYMIELNKKVQKLEEENKKLNQALNNLQKN